MFANAHYLYATSFYMNITALVCSEKRLHKCNYNLFLFWMAGWLACYILFYSENCHAFIMCAFL